MKAGAQEVGLARIPGRYQLLFLRNYGAHLKAIGVPPEIIAKVKDVSPIFSIFSLPHLNNPCCLEFPMEITVTLKNDVWTISWVNGLGTFCSGAQKLGEWTQDNFQPGNPMETRLSVEGDKGQVGEIFESFHWLNSTR